MASKKASKDKSPSKKVVKVNKSKDGIRLKKLTKRQSKKVVKKVQKQVKLPNSWILLGQSLRHLWRNKKLFAGILLIYGVLYILFVKGVSANFQLGNLKDNLEATFNGEISGLSSGLALYGLLLGSANTTSNQSGSVFQTIFVVVVSLALIWALRQTYAGSNKIRIRDAYYKSTYPLIPFLIVGFFILLQSLPALISISLFNIVQFNGLAVGAAQQAIAIFILCLGLLWTFYMLCSSLFALYIVTLPGETPRAALKAAKKLVKFKRLMIMRKLAILPISLLLFSAVILIPLIIVLPVAAEILFIIFTISVLSVVHSYIYTLYRSLL